MVRLSCKHSNVSIEWCSHLVVSLLSGFYRKYRSLAAYYPIELPKE
ncbi:MULTISPECIES: hypothetical protein [unclassified Collinsella]|nr:MULTISPECIES: hypothetical protein [unclassified Collinsella]